MILANDEEIGRRINAAVFPGLQGGPLMHVIAAKAVALGEALRPGFDAYAARRRRQRAGARRDLGAGAGWRSSRAAPTRICCWSICARSG